MKNESILSLITLGETRKLLKDLTEQDESVLLDVKEVIDATFNQKHEIAFRSAWILEHVYLFKLKEFLPYTTYFLNRFNEQNDPSAQRHFTKILAFMTDKKAPIEIKNTLYDYNPEKLIETLFVWLIGDAPVAVKAYCLSALANFAVKLSWIKEELLQTIDHFIDKESFAFYARAKKIRKQLEC